MEKYKVTVDGHTYEVEIEKEGTYSAPVAAPVVNVPKSAPVAAPVISEPKVATTPTGGSGVVAPIQGKVIDVKVSVGDVVKAGDIVVILEAMKMENEIVAEAQGTVSGIQVSVGDAVEAGAVLVSL